MQNLFVISQIYTLHTQKDLRTKWFIRYILYLYATIAATHNPLAITNYLKKKTRMIKIALPTRDGHIDDHFGHCDHYTIFEIDDAKRIVGREVMPSPQGCGCRSNIASTLAAKGVSIMLAGNMGEGAKTKLEASNIAVVRGCHGEIEVVLQHYLDGTLSDSGIACAAHDGDHQCSHGSDHHDNFSALHYSPQTEQK